MQFSSTLGDAMRAKPQLANFEALDACHKEIHAHLTALAALGEYIGASGIDHAAQKQAAEIEAFFSGTSQRHHAEEEKNVFPQLLASPDADLVAKVRTLQQDHGWIEENWIELAPLLRAIAEGNGWADGVEFGHAVEVFTGLCLSHIELEESLIYPKAKALQARSSGA
jgi:hemerythrin-like domain-containing protein